MIGSSDYGAKQFEDSLHYIGRFFLVTAKSNRRIPVKLFRAVPFSKAILFYGRVETIGGRVSLDSEPSFRSA